ncbi:MAG: leucine-rich repeat domain-containing protein [Treponema sp.]|nr:leucine-rich repeat domain-containing protein [Treponema sp.]
MMMRKRAVVAFAVIIGALLVMSGLTGCGNGNEEENNPYGPFGYIEETLEGGFVVWKYEDGTCRLMRYDGTATEVTIPNGITKIEGAFSGNSSIKKVTIPNSVTAIIDEMAFGNCTALETVIIGNGITEICNGAFFNCTALKTVTIGDGVKEIGDRAFYGCAKLTSVTIPDSVVSIGEMAFALGEAHAHSDQSEECPETALEKVVLGKGLKSIGWGAFYYCCYIKTVEYRGTLKDWCELDKEEYLLMSAESVTIPIGEGKTVDILNDTGLLADDFSIEIPEGTTKIGSFSFYHAKHLKGVTIPDSVKSIGNDAFNGCTGLSAVPTLSEGLTSIGDRAFYICFIMKGELVIPRSVNKVGMHAFDDCHSITKLEIKNGNMEFNSNSFSFNSLFGDEQVYSKVQTVILPEGLEEIPDSMFDYYPNLTTVKLSAGLKKIGRNAFRGCESLTDITIPAGTEEIGYSAFEGCKALEKITIPASMKSIGIGAFNACYVFGPNTTFINIEFEKTDGWYMCDSDSSYRPDHSTGEPMDQAELSDPKKMGELLSGTGSAEKSYAGKWLYRK